MIYRMWLTRGFFYFLTSPKLINLKIFRKYSCSTIVTYLYLLRALRVCDTFLGEVLWTRNNTCFENGLRRFAVIVSYKRCAIIILKYRSNVNAAQNNNNYSSDKTLRLSPITESYYIIIIWMLNCSG